MPEQNVESPEQQSAEPVTLRDIRSFIPGDAYDADVCPECGQRSWQRGITYNDARSMVSVRLECGHTIATTRTTDMASLPPVEHHQKS